MTAYWVSEYREITDETKLAAYAALGRPALDLAALGDGAVRDIRIVPGLD